MPAARAAVVREERIVRGSAFSSVVNHIQLHFFFAVSGNANGAASRFVRGDELGVRPGSGLYVIPGEEFVVTCRHFLKAKLPVVACHTAAVERRAPTGVGSNQDDRDICCRMPGAANRGTLNRAWLGGQDDFENIRGSWRDANRLESIFTAEANGFDMNPLLILAQRGLLKTELVVSRRNIRPVHPIPGPKLGVRLG